MPFIVGDNGLAMKGTFTSTRGLFSCVFSELSIDCGVGCHLTFYDSNTVTSSINRHLAANFTDVLCIV